MGIKVGRNDRCPCGSGRKYKKCCLILTDKGPRIGNALQAIRRASSHEECSAPVRWHNKCSSTIVDAHTIPERSLRTIARRGHVLGYRPQAVFSNNGTIPLTAIGVRKASTFRGFCGRHDHKIFRDVETEEFKGTKREAFLLAYRALARERHLKKTQARWLTEQMPTLARNPTHPVLREFAAGAASSQRSMKYYGPLLEDWLLAETYQNIEGFTLYTDTPPAVMCSGVFFPEETPNGLELQQFWKRDEVVPDVLFITSYYDGQKGVISLTWCKPKARASRLLIESMRWLSDGELATTITKLVFAHCENLYLSPDWWDTLDEQDQAGLQDLMFPSEAPVRTANPTHYMARRQPRLGSETFPITHRKWLH